FTCAPHDTRSAVILWCAYAALLWSVPRVLVTHHAARRYARLVFWLGAALAIQGMAQAASGGENLLWIRYAPGLRSFGPCYNRDDAANLLLMALGAGLGVAWSLRREEASPERSSSFVEAAGCAVIFLGLLACGSRGALAAIAPAAACLVFLGAGFSRRQ